MSLRRSVPSSLVLAALVAGAALAAGSASVQARTPTQTKVPQRDEATAVSPVLILPPTLPPKLVSTYPAEGQTVTPGVLILKVAFDQQMSPAAWNFGAVAGAEPMDCVKTPRLLADQRTFVLLCRVLADRVYGVTFNAERTGGFANLGDNPAQTATLTFKVESGSPITTVRRAMEAAGLKADQTPVQDAPAATSSGGGR